MVRGVCRYLACVFVFLHHVNAGCISGDGTLRSCHEPRHTHDNEQREIRRRPLASEDVPIIDYTPESTEPEHTIAPRITPPRRVEPLKSSHPKMLASRLHYSNLSPDESVYEAAIVQEEEREPRVPRISKFSKSEEEEQLGMFFESEQLQTTKYPKLVEPASVQKPKVTADPILDTLIRMGTDDDQSDDDMVDPADIPRPKFSHFSTEFFLEKESTRKDNKSPSKPKKHTRPADDYQKYLMENEPQLYQQIEMKAATIEIETSTTDPVEETTEPTTTPTTTTSTTSTTTTTTTTTPSTTTSTTTPSTTTTTTSAMTTNRTGKIRKYLQPDSHFTLLKSPNSTRSKETEVAVKNFFDDETIEKSETDKPFEESWEISHDADAPDTDVSRESEDESDESEERRELAKQTRRKHHHSKHHHRHHHHHRPDKSRKSSESSAETDRRTERKARHNDRNKTSKKEEQTKKDKSIIKFHDVVKVDKKPLPFNSSENQTETKIFAVNGKYKYPPKQNVPLPTCFYNPSGFVCCNLQLNNLIEEAFYRLKNAATYSTCNINRIANEIQKSTQRVFAHSFEVIVSLSDFAQNVNFAGDLVCKLELDGKYIMAYATPTTLPEVSEESSFKRSRAKRRQRRLPITQWKYF